MVPLGAPGQTELLCNKSKRLQRCVINGRANSDCSVDLFEKVFFWAPSRIEKSQQIEARENLTRVGWVLQGCKLFRKNCFPEGFSTKNTIQTSPPNLLICLKHTLSLWSFPKQTFNIFTKCIWNTDNKRNLEIGKVFLWAFPDFFCFLSYCVHVTLKARCLDYLRLNVY